MLPNLPENIHSVLMMIGIGIIIYSHYEYEKYHQQRQIEKIEFRISIDTLFERVSTNEFLLSQIKSTSELISARNNIENPLSFDDTLITFKRISSWDPVQEKLNDSIYNLYSEYKSRKFSTDQLFKKIERENKMEDAKDEILSIQKDLRDNQFYIGLCIFLIGAIALYSQQYLREKLLRRQILKEGKFYSYCQSCGVEFNLKNPKGTDSKGETFDGFCIYCYENGQFTNQHLTKEEVIEETIQKEKAKATISKALIKRRISLLERWQN